MFMQKLLCHSKIQIEFRMSYSSAGNDLYRLLPYHIARQPMCGMLNTVYRKSLMEDAKQYSNAPYSKDKNVDLCSLLPKVYWLRLNETWKLSQSNTKSLIRFETHLQGHYYFRNYSISPSVFPSRLEAGRYRLEFFIYEKNTDAIVNGIYSTQLVT